MTPLPHRLLAPLLATTVGLLGTLPATATPTLALQPVTDALGRRVPKRGIPNRIVIAGRGTQLLTGAVYLFPELGTRLVGISRSQQNQDFFGILDPEFPAKTFLERDVTAAEIQALQPDLVILKSHLSPTLGTTLEGLGIPVLYLDLETPEDYQRDLGLLGSLAGNPERAARLQAFYRTQMGRIQRALPTPRPRPQVLLLHYDRRTATPSLQVPPAHWLQTRMTQLAGGDPVWLTATRPGRDQGWIPVDWEQIQAWDPQWIFLVDYTGDAAQAVADVLRDPRWQGLQAVRGGQVLPFAQDMISWDQPDPRWILGLQWLTERLHPQVDLGLAANHYTLFVDIYGVDPQSYHQFLRPHLLTPSTP